MRLIIRARQSFWQTARSVADPIMHNDNNLNSGLVGFIGVVGVIVGMTATLVTSTSCILPEKCIFVPRPGHPWQGRVFGRALDDDQVTSIDGDAQDCKSDSDNAILLAADKQNPSYLALRNELLADAQLECAQEAEAKDFTNVDCDAFSGENDVAVYPGGAACVLAGEQELAKGDPKKCLEDDTGGSEADDGTTVVLPTTSDGATMGPDTTGGTDAKIGAAATGSTGVIMTGEAGADTGGYSSGTAGSTTGGETGVDTGSEAMGTTVGGTGADTGSETTEPEAGGADSRGPEQW